VSIFYNDVVDSPTTCTHSPSLIFSRDQKH